MLDSDIIFSNSSDNYKGLTLVFKKKDMFACQGSVLLDGFLFVELLSFCQFLSFNLLILYREKIVVLMNFFKFLIILHCLSHQISFFVILIKIIYKNVIFTPEYSLKASNKWSQPTRIRGSLLGHIKHLWEFSNKFSTKTAANIYSNHEWVNVKFEIDWLPNWLLII